MGNERVELAFLEPLEEVLEILSVRVWFPRRKSAPKYADDGRTFQENQIRLSLWDDSPREPDHEQPTVPVDGPQGLFEEVAAYRVVNDVGARAGGELFDLVFERGAVRVIHDV